MLRSKPALPSFSFKTRAELIAFVNEANFSTFTAFVVNFSRHSQQYAAFFETFEQLLELARISNISNAHQTIEALILVEGENLKKKFGVTIFCISTIMLAGIPDSIISSLVKLLPDVPSTPAAVPAPQQEDPASAYKAKNKRIKDDIFDAYLNFRERPSNTSIDKLLSALAQLFKLQYPEDLDVLRSCDVVMHTRERNVIQYFITAVALLFIKTKDPEIKEDFEDYVARIPEALHSSMLYHLVNYYDSKSKQSAPHAEELRALFEAARSIPGIEVLQPQGGSEVARVKNILEKSEKGQTVSSKEKGVVQLFRRIREWKREMRNAYSAFTQNKSDMARKHFNEAAGVIAGLQYLHYMDMDEVSSLAYIIMQANDSVIKLFLNNLVGIYLCEDDKKIKYVVKQSIHHIPEEFRSSILSWLIDELRTNPHFRGTQKFPERFAELQRILKRALEKPKIPAFPPPSVLSAQAAIFVPPTTSSATVPAALPVPSLAQATMTVFSSPQLGVQSTRTASEVVLDEIKRKFPASCIGSIDLVKEQDQSVLKLEFGSFSMPNIIEKHHARIIPGTKKIIATLPYQEAKDFLDKLDLSTHDDKPLWEALQREFFEAQPTTSLGS